MFLGERGAWLRVSVRAVGRSVMDLVWASKEGILSLANVTVVRCRKEGEVIWVQMFDPRTVRASRGLDVLCASLCQRQ